MAGGRRSRRKPKNGGRRSAGSFVDRLGIWSLRLLIVGVPLLVIPTMEDPFRLPKLLAAEFLALLSVGLLAFREGRSGSRPLLESAPARIAALLLVPALLSGWATEHPEHFRAGLTSLVIALVAFVAWSRWLRPDEVVEVLDWQLVPALALSLGVALQYSGVPLFDFEAGTRERLTWTSWAGGPFDLSAWLLLPVLWVQVRLLEHRGRRGPLIAALAILVAAVSVTQTISALVALGVASCWLWRARMTRRGAGLGVALVGAAVLLVGPARQRLAGKIGALVEGNWNDLLTGRLDGWKTALRMARDAPWLGVGHGGYRAEFGAAKLELALEGASFYPRQSQPYFVNAHSEVLEVLAEWGLVGLVCLLVAVAIFGRRWAAGRVPEQLRPIFGATALGLAVLSLANFPWRLALVAYPALLLFGVGLGAEDEAGSKGAEARPGTRRRSRWIPVTSAVVALAACFGAARAGLRDVEAQTILFGARTLVEAGSAAPRPYCEQAENLLNDAERAMPWDVRFDAARGDLFMILGRPHAAVRAYETALALEPRPEIQANLGLALRELDRDDEALDLFRTAVLVDPSLRPGLVAAVPQLRPSPAPPRTSSPESPALLFRDGFEGDASGWGGG